MNRLAALVCIIFISISTFAHERDTLRCHFAPPAVFTDTLYSSGNGGFLTGVNGYGDLEIAQKYGQAPVGDTEGTECSVADEHQLNEVIVYFGAKSVSNSNDTVYINVYSVNPSTGGPGTLLGSSFPVQLNFVDTSLSSVVYTDFLMQQPIVFADSFFLSVVFPQNAGDSLAVMSSADGEAQGTELCWMKNSTGSWSSLMTAHSLDADAFIFPIVGDVEIGINELSSVISEVNVFPNPARENCVFKYSIAKSIQQLKFTLIDISGNVVYTQQLNNNTAGEHIFNVDIIGFSSGSYYYSFESDRKKFNGKIEIVK